MPGGEVMTERLIEKLDRLATEAGIDAITPEIRRFALLVRKDLVAEWPAQHPDEFKCPLCYDDPANIKPAQQKEPVAWMRRWAFDGEVPATSKNDTGRWHWRSGQKQKPQP